MNEKIFKAYDIRGIYPSDIDEDDAYRIARATAEILAPTTVAVGRDVRASSPTLFESFTRGLMDSGVNVIDLGIVTTPMVYFASGRLEVDAAISLTASHNPPEYNGLKICLKNAVPVGENSGLREIRDRALSPEEFLNPEVKGSLTPEDIKPAYYGYFSSFADFRGKKFTVVIDTANAMGILELPIFKQFSEITIVSLYDDLTHPFSCHEANPLKTETLDELRAKVKEVGADLGIAYDGDADRIGFVDETGDILPMDLATALLAKEVLKQTPGATILYDLRSSKAVKEIIEENGGIAKECRVGHANIKRQMRDDGATFAGELSGHYYFAENSFGEASTYAAILLLNLLATTGEKMSVLAKEAKRYFHSGEINSEVADKDAVLATLREKYSDGEASDLDGLKVVYPNWWFNVRPSNTEPLLRLNLEADTPELMKEKTDELLAIIRG